MKNRHERREGIRTALLTLIAAASLVGTTLGFGPRSDGEHQ